MAKVPNDETKDISHWPVFGPMDQIQLGKLTEALDSANAEYKVAVSKEDLDSHQENIRNQLPTNTPNFTGLGNYFFIRVPLKNCLIIKKELEKIGFQLKETVHEGNLLQDEYLCPVCRHKSDHPGFCPEDGSVLLEFSQWVKHEERKKDRRFAKFVMVILIAVAVIYLLFQGLPF